MKKVFLLVLWLPVFTAMSAQPTRTSVREGQVLLDTVVAVACPVLIEQNEHHEWDFSALPATGAATVVSTLKRVGDTMTIEEETGRFYFEVRPDGNYFTGWDDTEKTVNLPQGYNRQPHLFVSGDSYTAPYSATGEYSKSGITTVITGTYQLEVLDTGPLLLPDGRRFCAATRVKTTDRYHETSCNTTEVQIEKHLWYVPYYPCPVFVAIETAYSYTGGGLDTLRSAYYTVNAMPKPKIYDSSNDTIICVGSKVKLHASGFGNFFLRNHIEDTEFEVYTDTVTVQPQQTTTYIFMAADAQCLAQPVYDTITVVVETPAVLQMLSRDTIICQTASMELLAGSDYELQWYELGSDEQPLELTETQVTPLVTTRYMAKAYNLTCPSAYDTITVVVETPAVLQLLSRDTIICQTASVELLAGSDYELQWYELDSDEQPLELTGTQVTPFVTTRYMAKAYNTACLSVYDTVTVTVETPAILQMLSCDTVICQTASMDLRALSDYRLQWYELNNGQPFELMETQIAPSVTTRYVAKAYNTACPAAYGTVTVMVNPVPEPVFTTSQSGNEVVFRITDPMINGYNYNFNFGDNSSAYNVLMLMHTYRQTGNYMPSLTVINLGNNCRRTASKQIEINSNPDSETTFLFYPNPVEYTANVVASDAISHYRVFDVAAGRMWMERILPDAVTTLQIDMQSLHPGAYVFQFRANNSNKWITSMFIKAQ